MKLFLTSAASALFISLSSIAFAQAPATPATPAAPAAASAVVTTPAIVTAGKADDTGMMTLGIDITKGGATSASVKAYNATLAADAQAKLKTNCTVVVANKATANAKTVKFCEDLAATN